ncbi:MULTISPECIES: LysR family transcriptional regulator [unclassified Achromobacter]|uniref:LysR family transcriptional regulator n=1 Tax=unclassified Achromobacter TaxID=2626865 RepID=UPI000B51D295|nr:MULTISPECIES: LysR substrate-binding domain-containing protein [unclassified Achromobacter]OWT76832.1 LysR family transcriptional regulator [Achromobacter sp. HZ28]OWT77712.1 LysR family transcriptional regulator [Achromobacter sp. HZ34]
MRLRHIELFEAIRATGSLSRAAQTLHISQPAASKMLAHAEAQVGFKLFERIKGRLQATREADILAPDIARLSRDLESVRKLAANLRHHPQGHLRLGCAPSLGLGIVPRATGLSRARQPDITFSIHTHHTGELIAGLLAREIDMAITYEPPAHPGIARIDLDRSEMVYVSREADHAPMPLAAVDGSRLISMDPQDPLGGLLQSALAEHGTALGTALRVHTHYMACAMVEAGCGDAIVDAYSAQGVARPSLSLRRLEPPVYFHIGALVHADDPLSSLHHGFLDCLRQACAEAAKSLP